MPDLKDETPRQMIIPVVEERHQAVFRRVAAPETVCCQEFEEEYGKQFRLLPDGGLVPAALSIERVKLSKITQDKPKIGWRRCPYCGAELVANIQAVDKPRTQNPEPETGS